MKKIVKIILFILVLAGVAAGVYYYMNMPLELAMAEAVPKTVELSFSEQGLVSVDDNVLVYPLTQGRLMKVNVTEGQSVKAGDVICELDPGPLRLQYEQAQSVSNSYRAQIANLDTERERLTAELTTSRNRLAAELVVLEAQERGSSQALQSQNVSVDERLRLQDVLIGQGANDLARAKSEMDKAQSLYEAGSLTRSEYDAAADLVVKCETALKAAELERSVIAGGRGVGDVGYYRSAREVINAQIEGIDKSLEADYTEAMRDYYNALIETNAVSAEQILHRMADCLVTSPVDGVIDKLHILNTNFVAMTGPVAEIAETGGNFIEVFVSTKDVDSINAGDTVGLTLKRREGDAVFSGRVADVGIIAETRYSVLGVEERKVKVIIDPHAHELAGASFGVGFEVDVKFIIYSEDGKIAVPKTAVYKDGVHDMVWAVRDGMAEETAVTTGMELRTEVVIESGLRAGDLVITDANNGALKNGAAVIRK